MTGHAPSTHVGPDRPVECVSWHDAIAFCNLFSRQSGLMPCYGRGDDPDDVEVDPRADGYRLPSDAQWQYACQAGSRAARYGDLDEIAWYDRNAGGQSPGGREAAERVGAV